MASLQWDMVYPIHPNLWAPTSKISAHECLTPSVSNPDASESPHKITHLGDALSLLVLLWDVGDGEVCRQK